MTWTGLGALVSRHRAAAARLALPVNPRLAAATLAMHVLGDQLVIELPTLVNVAALALAARERLVVHEVRPPVPRVVAETDLHALPDEPPALLRGPAIVEVRSPGPELLFGDVAALGCYELDGARYLVGLGYPDGCRVARWTPEWRGGDLGIAPERDTSLLEGLSADHHAAWAREAARYLVVLGLLLDAAGTPLRTRDEGPRVAGRSHGEARPARPWAVRRVYLDAREAERRTSVGGGGASLDGRAAVDVQVRGHLRRQPHGPGGRERQWVYVEAYEARRWVAPQARVVVGSTR